MSKMSQLLWVFITEIFKSFRFGESVREALVSIVYVSFGIFIAADVTASAGMS